MDYLELERIYPLTVIMRLRGKFFNCFNDSAYVLSALTGYIVKMPSDKSKPKCGFPNNALDKVVALLKSKNVNFVVFEGDTVVEKDEFGENNQFLNTLKNISTEENSGQIVTNTSGQRQKAVAYEIIHKDLSSAFLELQDIINNEIVKGRRVVSTSFIPTERQISKTQMLSGIVIYENCGD